MRHAIVLMVGIVGLIVGLAFFLTPIPLGFPLVGLSLMILVGTSRKAAVTVLAVRRRVSLFDRFLNSLEERGGSRIRRALRKTRPGRLGRVH